MAIDVLKNFVPGIRENGIVTDANVTLTGTVTLPTSTVLISPVVTSGATATSGQFRSSVATVLNGTAGTVSIDPTLGSVFTILAGTMTALQVNAASAPVGSEVALVVTTVGTANGTVTFNTNFKSTGTLVVGTVTAKVWTVNFYGDGTNLNETGRTTAM
jgi:hypothetical protein